MTPMFSDGKRLDRRRKDKKGAHLTRVATGERLFQPDPNGNRGERRAQDRQVKKGARGNEE